MLIKFGLVTSKGAFSTNELESSLLLPFLRDFSHENHKDVQYKINITEDIDGIYVKSDKLLKALEESFVANSLKANNIKRNQLTDIETLLIESEDVLIFPYNKIAVLDRAYVIHLNNKIKNG